MGTMQLGFAGLGQMGRPIAINLLKSGAELAVTARSDRAFPDLLAKGAKASTDPRSLAGAGIIFLCLPDGAVVQELLYGDQALAPLLEPGTIIVDFSTITHADTLELARRLDVQGVALVDAPISGMEQRAIDGTLTVMCGGDPAIFARVKPYLELIGSRILHMGPTGSGQLTKLVNQLLFDINAAAMAEVLPMAVRMGLDPAQVGEVVNSGTGRSYASEFFIPRILEGRFGDGYPMQAAYKDLVSGANLAATEGFPMPVLAAATATYQTALRRGLGAEDKGAMIKVFEDLLGAPFRKRQA